MNMAASWCFVFLATIILDHTECVHEKVDDSAKVDLVQVLKTLESLQSQNDVLVAKIEEIGAVNLRLTRENELILDRLATLERDNRGQEFVIRNLNEKIARSEQLFSAPVHSVVDTNKAGSVNTNNDQGSKATLSWPDDDDKDEDGVNHVSTQIGQRDSVERHHPTKSTRALLSEESGLVAFLATITPHDVAHLGIGQELIFDNVITNIGHAYYPNHGNFIAPYHGLYMFSATLAFGHVNSDHIYAHFVLNGKLIVKFLGENGYMASHTILLELNQGDDVFIAHEGGDGGVLLGDHYSSFAGQLMSRIN